MRMETLPLETDEWQASPVMCDAETWIEFAPVLRYRLNADPRIMPWTAGKAAYFAERFIAIWSGEAGVVRTLATAHHDGTALQPWFLASEERHIAPQAIWSYIPDTGLILAPHLLPVRDFDMYGLVRTVVEQPDGAFVRASVEPTRQNGLVHIRFEKPGAQHDYWLDPGRGWICTRSRVRSGEVLEEIEVTAFAREGTAWHPSAGIRTLRGVDESARARRYHFTATELHINPPPFDAALFKP
jgi:hypothetical protein